MPDLPLGLCGAFTTAQAMAAGWSNRTIHLRLASGHWLRLYRGVYTLPDPSPLTRAAAVVLASGGVASHLTAARLYGLWVLEEGEWATVPRANGCRNRAGLTLSRARLPRADVVTVRGVPVTTVRRTLDDLCLTASELQAVCAIESASRLGEIAPAELAELATGRRARIAGRVDPRSESPLETAVRLLLLDAGIETIPQVGIRDAAGVERSRIDLVVVGTRVAVECDGVSWHGTPQAVYRDRWRGNVLAPDWAVLRFTWQDVRNRPAYVVRTVRDAVRVAVKNDISDGGRYTTQTAQPRGANAG
jgi:very-short-patch-repair endonuclease